MSVIQQKYYLTNIHWRVLKGAQIPFPSLLFSQILKIQSQFYNCLFVCDSQSQWPKSHVFSENLPKSQFPFHPFRPLSLTFYVSGGSWEGTQGPMVSSYWRKYKAWWAKTLLASFYRQENVHLSPDPHILSKKRPIFTCRAPTYD